jgi:hypothetical protein
MKDRLGGQFYLNATISPSNTGQENRTNEQMLSQEENKTYLLMLRMYA